MIGSINYRAGTLIQVEQEDDLPEIGMEPALYYVRSTNSYYSYNLDKGEYVRLKSRQTSWYLSDPNLELNSEIHSTTQVMNNKLVNLEDGVNTTLDIGDMIYDAHGNIGIVTKLEYLAAVCTVTTLDSSVSRKTTYPDGSWEMWLTRNEGNGHYYWDKNTNILSYEGMNTDKTSPIVWEKYSIIGGAVNYTITGGTRYGTRKIMAWDSGVHGIGEIKLYYTKGNTDEKYTEDNEIITRGDLLAVITQETGIYCGYASTLTELNEGTIVGYPTGHTLSNNDWAYVMHYDENAYLYEAGKAIKSGDIVEYNGSLFIAMQNFTSTNWTTDSGKFKAWDGDIYTFIYRDGAGWTRATLVSSDNYEPDEVRLTKTTDNKSTIKAGGVDTQSIADLAVVTSKINNQAVTTEKLADGSVTRIKLDQDLTNIINKGDTMWYGDNLIVSTVQPAAPATGYILWVNSNGVSI